MDTTHAQSDKENSKPRTGIPVVAKSRSQPLLGGRETPNQLNLDARITTPMTATFVSKMPASRGSSPAPFLSEKVRLKYDKSKPAFAKVGLASTAFSQKSTPVPQRGPTPDGCLLTDNFSSRELDYKRKIEGLELQVVTLKNEKSSETDYKSKIESLELQVVALQNEKNKLLSDVSACRVQNALLNQDVDEYQTKVLIRTKESNDSREEVSSLKQQLEGRLL
jgi:hypothetical protein